jgi:hypothetical protein
MLFFADFIYPPYILGLTANRDLSLIIQFILDKPIKDKIKFPSLWRDFITSKSGFTKYSRLLEEINPNYIYSKYCFSEAPSIDKIDELYKWTIEKSKEFIIWFSDITNFSPNGYLIDPIYYLELVFSLQHILKLILFLLSTDHPYVAKNITFEVGDILSSLWESVSPKRKGRGVGYFQSLFSKSKRGDSICAILQHSSNSILQEYGRILKNIYIKLEETIKKSIWYKKIIEDKGIKIKEKSYSWDEVIGYIVRELRNTRHGYFSSLKSLSKVPFLSLTDGSLPIELPSLAIGWFLALLVNKEKILELP